MRRSRMGWIGVVARRCAVPFRVPSRVPPRVLLGSVALALSIVVGASRASEADYYALLTLPPPDGLKLEVTGMDTLEDGRLAAAIRKGEVWVFDNAYVHTVAGKADGAAIAGDAQVVKGQVTCGT